MPAPTCWVLIRVGVLLGGSGLCGNEGCERVVCGWGAGIIGGVRLGNGPRGK